MLKNIERSLDGDQDNKDHVEDEDLKKKDSPTKDDDGDKDEEGSSSADESESDDSEKIPDGVDPAEYWKEKYKKSLEDAENYKQERAASEAEKRNLDKGDDKKFTDDEEKVLAVLHKQNEKNALRAVVNSKSKFYIPELVPDNQYNEIIRYLPRVVDKSSIKSIVKSLQVAVRSWKFANGVEDDKEPKKKKNDLHVTKSKTSSSPSSKDSGKGSGRNFIKKSDGMDSWYKKDK